MTKLGSWINSNPKKPFGRFAIMGAQTGSQYAKENINNPTALLNINDYNWLEKKFKEINKNDKKET
jgi:hypothetical protein